MYLNRYSVSCLIRPIFILQLQTKVLEFENKCKLFHWFNNSLYNFLRPIIYNYMFKKDKCKISNLISFKTKVLLILNNDESFQINHTNNYDDSIHLSFQITKKPTFLFWFTIKIKLCIAKIVLLRLSRFILFTAFMFSLLAFTFRAIFDEQKLYCKYISDIQVWKLQIQMNHLIIKTIIIWKNWKDVCWRLDLESMIHNTAVFDGHVLSC